jgi:predicted nucleic acid-binding protein
MKAAVNASPLIFLAKLDMLDCLRVYEEIYTTKQVIAEIERGLNKGFQEALSIKKLVDEGFIVVKNVKSKKEGFGLHPGELSVIEMAKKMKLLELIVDDKTAIHVAKYFGLKVVSTPFLLLKNLKAQKIEYEEFVDAMDGLIGFGYYISPNLYVKILKKAEEL